MQVIYNDDKKNLVKFVFKENASSPFFDGNLGYVYPTNEEILVGLGEKAEFSLGTLKKAAYELGRFLLNKDITDLSFSKEGLDIGDRDFILAITEAIKLSSYNFDHYKSEKCKFNIENLNFPAHFKTYEAEVIEILDILDCQFLTRDLINLRSNDIYPETLADIAVSELAALGVEVNVYEGEAIREKGFTAFLEVAKGSDNLPRLVVMEYKNGGDKKPLALVGKGITYDTGGYSLKPNAGMKDMNMDMGGSATVIGAIKAIASQKLAVNVVGITALCENSLSGKSYKPGDVITARNGMTIEVDNTDAEGRITLADGVNYASTEYDPEMVIDIATLTGAVTVALGETYTGAVTNDEAAFEKVASAAKEMDEKIWLLPNDEAFKKANKSEIADIKNSGGRLGGAMSAGFFVGAFVADDKPWVHLDIAGTAYLSEASGLNQAGATGILVKTLYKLAKDMAN